MRNPERNFLLGIAMFGLIVLWLLLSTGGQVAKGLEMIRTALPPWFILTNLILAPCLLGCVGVRAWRIPLGFRLVLLGLGLCSYSIASLVYREHPLAFLAMLAVLFLEAYWIIPRWMPTPSIVAPKISEPTLMSAFDTMPPAVAVG